MSDISEAVELAFAAKYLKSETRQFAANRCSDLTAADLDAPPDINDPYILKKLAAMLKRQMAKANAVVSLAFRYTAADRQGILEACRDTCAHALDDSICVHIHLAPAELRTQAAIRFMRLDIMESGFGFFPNNAQKTAQKFSRRQAYLHLSD